MSQQKLYHLLWNFCANVVSGSRKWNAGSRDEGNHHQGTVRRHSLEEEETVEHIMLTFDNKSESFQSC